jgi:hypothetical protein
MTSAQPGRAKVPDVTRLPRINGQLLDLRISKCDYPISGAVAKSSRKTTALRGRRLVARAPRCLNLIIALRALLPSVLRDGGRNPDNERRGWRGFGGAGDIFETRSYYLL